MGGDIAPFPRSYRTLLGVSETVQKMEASRDSPSRFSIRKGREARTRADWLFSDFADKATWYLALKECSEKLQNQMLAVICSIVFYLR